MADRGTIRAFLAMDPPPEVLRRIADIQEVLKKTLRGSISWVRPEGIHLTLKFFGDMAAEDLPPISEVVSGQAAGTRPLHLNIKGLGVFPGITDEMIDHMVEVIDEFVRDASKQPRRAVTG